MRFLIFLKGQGNLKQIDVSEDDDFVDLQLTVTKYWKDDDEHHIVQAKGLWGRETVGLAIAFRPDMKLGIVDTEVDKKRFYREGVNFYSIGKISDNFTRALHSLFQIDGTLGNMQDSVGSTAFIVSGRPEHFDEDYIKAKVFFDGANEKNLYAEWYVNVDLKNKILELREKDPEYRKNILTILTNV